jgi:allantoinase
LIATERPAPDYLTYSPIVDRPRITWPDGAHVAVWVAPNVEFYEYDPPSNPYRTAWPRVPTPDVCEYSRCDYGNRVGFWRTVEVLDHHGIRVTASLNLAIFERCPEIGEAMIERDWDYLSHGIYNTRYLFGMSEDDERSFIQENLDILRRHTGKELKGMFGPHGSSTPNTMRLMAEAGLLYSCDWLVDDQPFPLNVPGGRLVGVPYTWEVNDGFLMSGGVGWGFGASEGEDFLQVCKDQFDVLYREGAESGRVMCIALHPHLIGQPHRVRYLDQALSYILGHDRVWVATADEIAEHYLANCYDAAIAHAGG